jgi:hypothetical protein
MFAVRDDALDAPAGDLLFVVLEPFPSLFGPCCERKNDAPA